jgi:hypothetical protein
MEEGSVRWREPDKKEEKALPWGEVLLHFNEGEEEV